MSLSPTSTLQTSPSKDNHPMPNWFELFLRKKRSLVPATLPVEDLVRKCLGKTSKTKRPKIETL